MIICADDFGLASDINEAILDLARRKRISSVSCMVALPQCSRESLKPLIELGASLDLGLHFVMNERSPVDLNGFGSKKAKKKIAEQYALFVEKTGREPDFIDGHFHVHQLPGIGKGVLDFIGGLPEIKRPYVRNTYVPIKKILRQNISIAKNVAISFLGGFFLNKIKAKCFKTNHGFSGIYDYAHYENYPRYLKVFLECMESKNGILMVHPGYQEAWRKKEFETLMTCGENMNLNRFHAE